MSMISFCLFCQQSSPWTAPRSFALRVSGELGFRAEGSLDNDFTGFRVWGSGSRV